MGFFLHFYGNSTHCRHSLPPILTVSNLTHNDSAKLNSMGICRLRRLRSDCKIKSIAF